MKQLKPIPEFKPVQDDLEDLKDVQSRKNGSTEPFADLIKELQAEGLL